MMQGTVKIAAFVELALSVIDTDPEYFWAAFQGRFFHHINSFLSDDKNSDVQAIKQRIWDFEFSLLGRYPSTTDSGLIFRLLNGSDDEKNQILDLLWETPEYEGLRNSFVDHQIWAIMEYFFF
jgi:hypothetical protein